ncbi:TonB-dependent receptor [Chitinophaga qingshengii]|uniref:TonB-dependent receptor n=1 Tax=Chitinophaga qingshengii TaxID=1569794 RepID=A0ABR7TKF1_9BACT|nr:carboxypeptidase regulatory-like domain-containing protein [Chitinophaga qingshengii]MBC9929967.1 TonB-dependent receptor [Chitinophaga qingshengii]
MGFKKLLFTLSLLLTTIFTYAQVTTSSMIGVVTDSKGEGLIGATVKATHTPSGTVYGTTTRVGGEFTIPNMRVGGPYKVEVSFISYGTENFNNIFLQLGTPQKLNVKLTEGTTNLQEINITANKVVTQGNGGTALNVSRTQIDNIPTVNRSVQDFAKLSPQASVTTNGGDGSPLGISFGGASNKYNQFAVDGAVTNDVFGLSASGTNGGQAGANPISIETIDQLQIVLNPYDVKQSGFTGGGINAITKSGTNDFHGSAYLYLQNNSFVGKAPDSTHSKYGDFNSKIYGASLGGPIIKNKLFFFANVERTERNNPVDYNPATGANNVKVDELARIYNFVKDKYGVDLGSYTDQTRNKTATTIFGRVDWNINNIHKLTIRHNYLDASDINTNGRNATSKATFFNNYYSFPSKSNSSVIELNSSFSNKLSNELRVGYNNVQDRRSYLGQAFPTIQITDNNRNIYLGSEPSSTANALDQKIWTFTDNLTMYHGKHTITVGANAELYNIKNTFIQNAFGAYAYDSINQFLLGMKPRQYQINYTTADSTQREGVGFKAAQIGFYAQDEWNIRRNFTLTAGVRVDIPIFSTTPPDNVEFNKDANFAGYATTTIPKSRPLVAPRVGFNWDVTNDGQTIIRGGAGIFTGRVPFVWISNQYNTSGNLYTNVNLSGANLPNGVTFQYDPNSPFYGQYTASMLAAMGANIKKNIANINLTDKNFKFPQVFKTNLAVERQLPWGMKAIVEGNFAKTLNNAVWNNLNVIPTNDSVALGGGLKRPTYKLKTPNWGPQVLLLQNTNEGYTYNISGELSKVTSNGLFVKVGYSYGDAYSLNDGTSSTASSNWKFTPNVNGLNNLDNARANYSMGHRVMGVIAKTFKYGKQKNFATTVSLFYNGQSGTPYSWVYFNQGSDPTGDDIPGGNGNNDLIYIPTATELTTMRFDPITQGSYTRTEAQQRQDLENLISNDKYLSKHRGENAKRNGSRTPFENVFDFKLAQVLPIWKNHKVEITFDILNVGNLLNKEWGQTYFISNQAATPITYRSMSNGTPVFQYDYRRIVNGYGDVTPYVINNFTSRWRGQLGFRYSF